MISEGHSYAIKHRDGRYLLRVYATNRTKNNMPPSGPPPYGGFVYRLVRSVRDADRARNPDAIGRLIAEYYWDRSLFSIVRAPVCACCGDWDVVRHENGGLSPYRCAKHRLHNPCVIEGCTRVRAAPLSSAGTPVLANNQTFCSEHWRRYVPPRSPARLAYHRFWRIAKRQATPDNPHGWTMALDRRFQRFWRGLVQRARRRATEGHIDEAAIMREFGWDEPGG